jgi:hypothetical protein
MARRRGVILVHEDERRAREADLQGAAQSGMVAKTGGFSADVRDATFSENALRLVPVAWCFVERPLAVIQTAVWKVVG